MAKGEGKSSRGSEDRWGQDGGLSVLSPSLEDGALKPNVKPTGTELENLLLNVVQIVKEQECAEDECRWTY